MGRPRESANTNSRFPVSIEARRRGSHAAKISGAEEPSTERAPADGPRPPAAARPRKAVARKPHSIASRFGTKRCTSRRRPCHRRSPHLASLPLGEERKGILSLRRPGGAATASASRHSFGACSEREGPDSGAGGGRSGRLARSPWGGVREV